MNVEVTKLPESKVALKVELSPAEVDQALDRTYKQLVQRVTVPGFRKGKAPRPVVERMVGNDLFLHEATEEAVRWGYRKAVDQVNVTPIDEAEITPTEGEHDHLEAGEAYRFEATVAIKPEVQLPDYHTIHIERPQVEVTESDVDSLLNDLLQRNATLEPVVRPAAYGDVVTMNVTARVGGGAGQRRATTLPAGSTGVPALARRARVRQRLVRDPRGRRRPLDRRQHRMARASERVCAAHRRVRPCGRLGHRLGADEPLAAAARVPVARDRECGADPRDRHPRAGATAQAVAGWTPTLES